MRRLYFDHNATCPLRANARAALREAGELPLGNPSSAHAEGRRARRLLEEARERLAAVAGCARDEVVFTSGGTESNALALRAGEGVVLHAPIEHPSVLRPLAARGGARALPVDRWGRVDPGAIARAAGGERPALLSVALANHETGVVQDGAALARAAHAAGARVHCDASQALGKWPLSFRDLDADLLTLSAHKVGGPPGVGALLVRKGTPLAPLLLGGEQEGGARAGTEAAALARAFAAAAEEAEAERAEAAARWSAWIAMLRTGLATLEPAMQWNSPDDDVLPNTLNASFPGRSGAVLVQRLDLEGVAVSHGSACATGSRQPSPVLLALGADERRARAAVRFSVGPTNVEGDVEELLARIARVLRDVAPRE
ncbi:MAG TPA: aminotransferase class V-fold PLP-dependent enzyme [Planctomycetota bacterium]|nr:aminotransferase class V-fold PLP-dependent enzyme [Planctomycetota bacterium]